jgi:vacuolar-type H+-ATPase subunit E/Vma4
MNDAPDISAFEEKILEDAGRESSSILAQARLRREDKLAAARRQADREHEEIVSRAREQAEKDRKRLLTEAGGEARNLLLLAREQAVDEAFVRAREQAETFRGKPDYRAALRDLIVEAARAVARPEMEIALSPRDFRSFGREIAGEVERAGKDARLPPAAFTVAGEGADEPGALVRAAAGRVSFDNTFSARFRRLAPYLRRLAYRELFGGEAAVTK